MSPNETDRLPGRRQGRCLSRSRDAGTVSFIGLLAGLPHSEKTPALLAHVLPLDVEQLGNTRSIESLQKWFKPFAHFELHLFAVKRDQAEEMNRFVRVDLQLGKLGTEQYGGE